MQWLAQALVVCTVVALGWACCTPDQWEGVQTNVAGYSGFFHHGLIKEYNEVAYDYTGKRSAIFLRYVNGDIEAKIRMLVQYEDEGGTLYLDDLDKHKCWKRSLKGEFRKACVPEDAKPYGEFYLGLDGGYKAQGFNVRGKRVDSYVTVQPVDEGVCAPIGELATGRVGHYDVLRNVAFINIRPGIKNESVFDIPEDCEEDWSSFELPLEVSREDYILAV